MEFLENSIINNSSFSRMCCAEYISPYYCTNFTSFNNISKYDQNKTTIFQIGCCTVNFIIKEGTPIQFQDQFGKSNYKSHFINDSEL